MLRRKGWIFCCSIVISLFLFYKQLPATTEPVVKKSNSLATKNILEFSNDFPTQGIIERKVPENDFVNINIDVNRKQKIDGIKFKERLYIPFDFLSEYFGLYGEFVSDNSFKWYHVNPLFADAVAVYPRYTISAEYLSFQTSNVPKRARVKCICGKHEVPITTQWDPKGYYYPTQIAQYGLSFLSKYHVESKSKTQKKISIPQGKNYYMLPPSYDFGYVTNFNLKCLNYSGTKTQH